MDPVEKGKRKMGSFERAVSGLPGIEGYREKEMRRAADKQLRDAFSKRLGEQRLRLDHIEEELLSSGGLTWMDDVERVASQINLLADRVRTASYGYAPFFDLQRVKEAELERLIEFDRSLMDQLPRLEAAIAALLTAVTGKQGIKEAILEVTNLLRELNETFGRRAETMQGAE